MEGWQRFCSGQVETAATETASLSFPFLDREIERMEDTLETRERSGLKQGERECNEKV